MLFAALNVFEWAFPRGCWKLTPPGSGQRYSETSLRPSGHRPKRTLSESPTSPLRQVFEDTCLEFEFIRVVNFPLVIFHIESLRDTEYGHSVRVFTLFRSISLFVPLKVNEKQQICPVLR